MAQQDIFNYFATPETQALLAKGDDTAIANKMQTEGWTPAQVAEATGTQGRLAEYESRYAAAPAKAAVADTAAASNNTAAASNNTTATAPVGYTGFTGTATPPDGVNMRLLIERTTGKPLDSSFYTGPDAEKNLALVQRVSNAMYGNVGANMDARNWTAIMASSDPLKAAEDALKAMYSDKAYLAANTGYVMAQGYLPEQADYTYQQMAGRVGSTYTPTWVEGTKFAGVDPVTKQPKMDTATYLKNVNSMPPDQLAAYTASRWNLWGGNPTVKKAGVVDTGTSTNSVFNSNAATNAGTGATANVAASNLGNTTGSTTGGATGSTTGAGSSVVPGLIAGAANNGMTSGQSAPTQLNTGASSGLITKADSLGPNLSSIPNTATGNVNNGGLISGVQQQLFTQNAQVGLPTGVTPKVGVMGNNTGGASITPYNPYGFTGSTTGTGAQQNWYNPKTGQRYTAPAGAWTPPSADWVRA